MLRRRYDLPPIRPGSAESRHFTHHHKHRTDRPRPDQPSPTIPLPVPSATGSPVKIATIICPSTSSTPVTGLASSYPATVWHGSFRIPTRVTSVASRSMFGS